MQYNNQSANLHPGPDSNGKDQGGEIHLVRLPQGSSRMHDHACLSPSLCLLVIARGVGNGLRALASLAAVDSFP